MLDTQLVEKPVIQRPVIFEFQRANRMRDAFDRVRLAMRKVVGRINAPNRPHGDAVLHRLETFDGKLDALRKQIVATTEGGAITGEERLREHTDQLYGAILSWDGAPSAYQLENITALRGELTGINAEFDRLTQTELPSLNKTLQSKGAQLLTVPPPTAFDDDDDRGAEGVVAGGRFDPDAAHGIELPRNLRLWN
jgi:hypothetical protein